MMDMVEMLYSYTKRHVVTSALRSNPNDPHIIGMPLTHYVSDTCDEIRISRMYIKERVYVLYTYLPH